MPGSKRKGTKGDARRGVCFSTKEVFADAASQLWGDKKPFQLLGGTCIAVPYDVAEYILERFRGSVEEIPFVEVWKLPLEEAARVRAQRDNR